MMIVEIKNFGPIESFTFDLNKDLHFIIGENGVGKSYASYCLYCLLKQLKQNWAILHPNFINIDFEGIDSKIENALENLKTAIEVDITNIFSEIIKQAFTIVFLPDFSNSLLNTFSSIHNLKNKHLEVDFSITIKSGAFNLTIQPTGTGDLEIKSVIINSSVKIMRKEKAKSNFIITINNKEYKLFHKKDALHEITNFSNVLLGSYALESNVKEVIFLPSSRSGLYQALSSFSSIIAELAQKRFLLKNKKIELPALSEPLSDYFIDISTINKNHINENILPIVERLEQKIIKGEVHYDESTNQINYKPNDLNLTLDISETSSMVAELSTIVLVLKHVVNNKTRTMGSLLNELTSINNSSTGKRGKNRKTILFIEEPEAHLHPDAQINLIEIFAELNKHDITLVLTSHSDYMFNKLNNMILDHKVDPKRIGIYHLINTPKGSIVNPEVQATEDGMIDENFAQAAVKLYEERMDILERQNSTVL